MQYGEASSPQTWGLFTWPGKIHGNINLPYNIVNICVCRHKMIRDLGTKIWDPPVLGPVQLDCGT